MASSIKQNVHDFLPQGDVNDSDVFNSIEFRSLVMC